MEIGDGEWNPLLDANAYLESYRKCRKGCGWKESVQAYEANILKNVFGQMARVADGTYRPLLGNEFQISERGKTRDIKAVHVNDRVIMRNFCDNVLMPAIGKYLAYDNGASIKGKGIGFTRGRLEAHLHRYYMERGSNEGWILLMDFSKFFDNIQHEKLMEEYGKYVGRRDYLDFIRLVLDSFAVDVSYMDDEEYGRCMGEMFNALEYAKTDRSLRTGEKLMRKSVGIGSQISQASGLLFPTRVDNYCKVVKGVRYYGRYMDDVYAIHRSREFLAELLDGIRGICAELGIFINERKTRIAPLDRQFAFLKTRYILTDTGRVVKKLPKDAAARERRRLKKYRQMVDDGRMPYEDVRNSYKSWRGNTFQYSAWHARRSMDELYGSLFSEEEAAYAGRKGRNDGNEQGAGNGAAGGDNAAGAERPRLRGDSDGERLQGD